MHTVDFGRKLIADTRGGTLVEFTLVFPIVASLVLGAADIGYLLYNFGAASKATHRGVRLAVVTDPVSSQLTNLTWPSGTTPEFELGKPCYKPDGTATGACPTLQTYRCTSGADGAACPSKNVAAFNAIVAAMTSVYPYITAANVIVTYAPTGLGFVGRPGSLPMTVTVELQCMAHPLFFLDGLMSWLHGPVCQGGPSGMPVGRATATMTSESLGYSS